MVVKYTSLYMKTNYKQITHILLIIATAATLAGCTGPTNEESEQIDLNFDSEELGQEEASNTLNSETDIELSDATISDTVEGNVQGEQTIVPQKEYKTLEDFKQIEATQAVLETTKGTLVLDLYREKAPLTTANFLDLIDSGFYDGIIFHRVIAGFMAQVGDPQTKTPGSEALWGTGGPGYKIMDEFDSTLTHDSAGILSMANSGPNTGGSQIFITHEATPHLDGKHAVFGKIAEGMDVLMSIEKGDKIVKASYR